MFVPYVPIVPSTTVVNNKIVYNDTVLSLNELGKDLIVTSISLVDKFSLEDCLRTVLKANPDVVFNTIQYSSNDKKVYFYTNKEISTKEYEDDKTRKRTQAGAVLILKDIKNVLEGDKVNDPDSISLYDVSCLMRRKKKEYYKMIDFYEDCINKTLRLNYEDAYAIIRDFNYEANELRVGFKVISTCQDIYFSKKDNDLFIIKSNSLYDKDVMFLVSDIVSDLYDKFEEYKYFFEQNKDNIKSVNSNFSVDISEVGTGISVKNKDNKYIDDFSLVSYNIKNKYDLDCNSNTVIKFLKDKEDEIFKRIFVRIDDCPLWIQEDLYNFRLDQLESWEKETNAKRVLKK